MPQFDMSEFDEPDRRWRWRTDAEIEKILPDPEHTGLGSDAEGHWFVDETGCSCFGPYETVEDAMDGLRRYTDSLG